MADSSRRLPAKRRPTVVLSTFSRKTVAAHLRLHCSTMSRLLSSTKLRQAKNQDLALNPLQRTHGLTVAEVKKGEPVSVSADRKAAARVNSKLWSRLFIVLTP